MKKIPLLFILSFTSLSNTYAQTNTCHGDWGPWYNVYTFAHDLNFRMSFKYLLTTKEGCTESYYRFDNPVSRPGAYLKFKFSYKKKDGSVGIQTFDRVELDRAGLKQDNTADWYLGYDMIKIYDIQYIEPKQDQKPTNKDLGLKPPVLATQSHADSVKAHLPKPQGDAMSKRADNTTPANQSVLKNAALSNGNAVNAQKQQYQHQANSYLNAANNSNDNQIQQSLNLNLAEINAAQAGNNGQVAQIQQIQNEQLADGITNTVTSLFSFFLNRDHHEKIKPPVPNPNDKGYDYYRLGDFKQAMKWYKKAADEGNANAMLNVGLMYENSRGVSQDYFQALEWYKKASDKGNASATFKIATVYAFGQGVKQDNKQAFEWYKKAAISGNVTSMYNVGYCYSHGEGVPQDYLQAMTWYNLAAQRGDCEAMNNIGLMYDHGRGVPQDYAQALKWYKKAAEDEDESNSMYNLGAMYAQGHGVPVDNSNAFKWFKKSADLGNSGAMFTLAIWYEGGVYVDKNLDEAINLYKKAASKGNQQASAKLKKLGIN